MRARSFSAAALMSALAIACQAVLDLGPDPAVVGQDAASVPASVTDASSTDGPVDARAEASRLVLYESRFEPADACADWVNDNSPSTAAPEVDAGRSGRACKLCGAPGEQDFYMSRIFDAGVGIYGVEAWIAAPNGKPVRSVLVETAAVAYPAAVDFDGAAPEGGRGFVPLTLTSQTAIANAKISVGGEGVAGDCVVVDDVTVFFTPQ